MAGGFDARYARPEPPMIAALGLLLSEAQDVVAVCGDGGTVMFASAGVARLTGSPAESWLGRDLAALCHPGDEPLARAKFREACAAPGRSVSFDARMLHTAGWRYARVTVRSFAHEPAIGGVAVTVTALGEPGAPARPGSSDAYDRVTDLANRTLFVEQLALALEGSDTHRVSLALISVDGLTAACAPLAPHAVDEVLVLVAERLRRGVRPHDLVARLGEEEFAVLLGDIGPEHVDSVAERMMTILAEPLSVDGQELAIPATVGIADARPGGGPAELLRHAEIARSEAMIAGKGRYARYEDEMGPRASTRAQMIEELNRALIAEEFELHYQPIVTLPGNHLAGVEALLRWRHPQRGLVPPLDFIPLAEQTGLIVPLGRWVLESACRQAATWLAQYPVTAPATISVNVSARQLREPSIVDDVAAALGHSGLPPARLVVEVTETAVLDHVAAGHHLHALHELGVRIALDDFGTGHSTLSLLDKFPIDQLKLDRSFLRDPGNDLIAVAVAKIAQAIGAEVVAEGVEVSSQAERMYALGYGLAQGFYFGRPSTVTSMTEVLSGTQWPVSDAAPQ